MSAKFKGIDVSKWQGDINWKKVKEDRIDFAILRAGYGREVSQKDVCFEKNYENAKAAGIPIGAYTYSYAKDVEGAKLEANAMLQWLKGKTFEFPIVFDVEERSVFTLGKRQVSEIIKAFCSTVEEAGYYVAVYANKNWLDNVISDEVKAKYDVWLAQWATSPTYKGNFGIWQYSSSGRVDGINGNVDLNIAYKDYPKIIKKKGLNGFTKGAPTKEEKAEEEAQISKRKYRAGDKIELNNEPLYVSSTAKNIAGYKSGTFYVYDNEVNNGRIRITNSPDRVGKKPTGENTTGFIKVKE